MSKTATRGIRPCTLVIPRWLMYELQVSAKEAAPDEIGWMGQVRPVDSGIFLGKCHLVKQKVSGATFEWDEKAYDTWFQDIAMGDLKRREEKRTEIMPELKCVVHSHVQMGTFFSGTDEEVNRSFANSPWMVALVINTKGDMKAKLVYQEPIVASVDLKVEIADDLYGGLRPKQEIIAEVREKISKPTYTSYTYTTGQTHYSDYANQRWYGGSYYERHGYTPGRTGNASPDSKDTEGG